MCASLGLVSGSGELFLNEFELFRRITSTLVPVQLTSPSVADADSVMAFIDGEFNDERAVRRYIQEALECLGSRTACVRLMNVV